MDDLFDWEESRRRKEEGMGRAEDNADEAWKAAALTAAYTAAKEMPYLITDDVVKRIPDTVRTHEMRAMGRVMLNAAKAGWIIKADTPGLPSSRPSLHHSPRTVWRSLIHG